MELQTTNIDVKLIDIEKNLKQNCDTIDLKVEHQFFNGMYWRKLYIPKGVTLIGKRHREVTMNMLIKGSMVIYDEHSSINIEAGWYGESDKFTKKAGYAYEDSVFVNIHVTDETDLDKLEEMFIIEEDEYIALSGKENKCLG